MQLASISKTSAQLFPVAASNDTSHQHTTAVPFFSVLTDAINKAIVPKYAAPITLISYPSQGDFLWYYQNMNGVFNQGTFDYISAKVSQGQMPYTAALSPSGGFPNAYSTVISSLYYSLSSKDVQKLNNATAQAQMQGMQVVSSYETAFGTITDDQLNVARAQYGDWVKTKLDYVIDVVIAGRWSGHESAGLAPLSYTQMANAPDLTTLLPNLPVSGVTALNNLKIYLNKISTVTTLSDSASNGYWTVQQLKNNTMSPSAANGGAKLVNPNTGAISGGYQVAYNVANSIMDISNDLQNINRSMTIALHIKKVGATTIDIYTAWDETTIDTISYSLPDSVYVNLYPLSSGQSDQIIELVYYGFTMVATGPLQWNDTTNKGWYAAYPINQALKNDTQDITGYKFASWPPPYNMNSYENGGDFGYLSNLLICNYQKVAITMGYSGNATGNGGKPTTTQSMSVPTLQQTAYVIGGSFKFPGTNK